MSLAIALLIAAQSAAPQAVDRDANSVRSAGARPVGVQVRASTRIIRSARIDTSDLPQTNEQRINAQANGIQRSRDAAGTLWVEFN